MRPEYLERIPIMVMGMVAPFIFIIGRVVYGISRYGLDVHLVLVMIKMVMEMEDLVIQSLCPLMVVAL